KFLDNQSDIHYIYLPEKTRPDKVAIIKGVVTDINGNTLQADIVWEDLDNNTKLGNLKTDPATGEYIITLPLGKNYGFYVSKTAYYPVSDNLDLSNFDQNITVVKNFQLIDEQQIIQGQAAIQLHNVFFDFDKYDLKSTSYPELNRLAEFIKLHPDLKIEISGHTDNRGYDYYNNNLSQDRATAVKDYLISQGCNQAQLISKGYGSTKPIANNTTDYGRQQNRRVEFKVLQ
ncbi:MAG: OmpA family protein, partial [Bacteroidales bacterium]|nr:OmpA family protein [Bacteroidales bacterium]